MTEFIGGAIIALWLGVQTSISPCPLATNIAAISFIGRQLSNKYQLLLSGLLYTAGRTIVYLIIGVVFIGTLQEIHTLSGPLQRYSNIALGPVLIIAGMGLLGLLGVGMGGKGVGEKIQKRVEKWPILGAALLGAMFAVSFCPISAGLFFGGLFALAIRHESRLLYPILFGVGTALPVSIFAILISFSLSSVGRAFNAIGQIERWARRITGGIFIAVGMYYCLSYIIMPQFTGNG